MAPAPSLCRVAAARKPPRHDHGRCGVADCQPDRGRGVSGSRPIGPTRRAALAAHPGAARRRAPARSGRGVAPVGDRPVGRNQRRLDGGPGGSGHPSCNPHAGTVPGSRGGDGRPALVDRPSLPTPAVRSRACAPPPRRTDSACAGPGARCVHSVTRHLDPEGCPAARCARCRQPQRRMGHAALAAGGCRRPTFPCRNRRRRHHRTRPGARRATHADRRHVGVGQERTPAVDGGGAGGQPPADSAQLPVRRLQGRRILARVRAAAAHGRIRHQPQRRTRPPSADVAGCRAQSPNGDHGGTRQGPCRTAERRPDRGAALAGDRDRRVRHVGQGGPRVRRRCGRHRAAWPQPRNPSGARHPTADGCRQREHFGEHEPADLAADARSQRVELDHRQPGRRRHPGSVAGPRARSARPTPVGRVPECLRQRPAGRR